MNCWLKNSFSLLITLLLLSSVSYADIYRSVSPDGSVVFSDSAQNNHAQPVTLSPISVSKSGTTEHLTTQDLDLEKSQSTAAATKNITITRPKNDETLWNQPEIFVKTSVQPALDGGDKVQLQLDGKVIQTNSKGEFKLIYLERGTHQLQAVVVNKAGRALGASPAITIYVHRTNLNNQANPPGVR